MATKANADNPSGERQEGVQDPGARTPTTADEAVANAPDPSGKGGGKNVRVLYPTDQFVVEGVPVITQGGVKMSATDADKVAQVARTDSSVRVFVDDEEVK